MPRRRMIDPSFWDDHYIATLSRDERILLLGCMSNADDEGRLKAHPAYLKAAIFMYDSDLDASKVDSLKQSCLSKMGTWPKTHPYNMISYQNANEEYLCFPCWYDMQKPSHPSKSRLPPPPTEALPIFSSEPHEDVESPTSAPPPQSSLGQSSLGKYSIGQSSAVLEDFTIFIDREKDLTDFLMTTLEKHVSAGRVQALARGGGLGEAAPGELAPDTEAAVKMNFGIQVLEKCWEDGVGTKIPQSIFDGARKALKDYPLEVVAKAFAKGVKYKGGRHKSWKYIQTIIDEEMAKSEN